MLTWAFEFEDQPYFEGFRTLATNGVDKPVLNLFRMAARMHGDRVAVESSGGIVGGCHPDRGVRGAAPDVDAIAVRSDREISILVWNYHDDDLPGPEARCRSGCPAFRRRRRRATVRHYRIDETHSNAWTAWKNMGSPQQPTAEQYAALEAAGQLQELKPPRRLTAETPLSLDLQLPRQGISLLQLSW